MSSLPLFTDRRYEYGREKEYQITHQDGSTEIVQIEKLGIAEEGSRINAAALNPIVNHVNDDSIHISRAEFEAAISSLRNEVQLIKSTFPDSFTHNLFSKVFTTLDGVILTRGYFNEAQARLEV